MDFIENNERNLDILSQDSDSDFFEKWTSLLGQKKAINTPSSEKFEEEGSFLNQSKEEFNCEIVENPYRRSAKSFYVQENFNVSFDKMRKARRYDNSSFCLEKRTTTMKSQFSRSSKEVFLGIKRKQAASQERLDRNKSWLGDLKSQVKL